MGRFQATLSAKEKRASVVRAVTLFEEEKRLGHSAGLARQSAWMQWANSSLPFDLSWNNLIYGPGRYVLRFVLNSSVNWVRTPDMLATCGFTKDASCRLCKSQLGSISHILSGCDVALTQKRYTWRHDSVLKVLGAEVRSAVAQENSRRSMSTVPPLAQSFVRAGQPGKAAPKRRRRPRLLDGASDWETLVDYHSSPYVFPPEIFSTSLRPDIVIWSKAERRALLVELSCPSEENIEIANLRKGIKYASLADECRRCGWTVHVLPVEVGARGFVGKSVLGCLKQLGVSPRRTQKTVRLLSSVAARCSYTLYLASSNPDWDVEKPLLEPDGQGAQGV